MRVVGPWCAEGHARGVYIGYRLSGQGMYNLVLMELIETPSVVDTATHQLRRAILNGGLPPGSTIRIRDVQESLGISHIPIREAIRQLEAEGLVVIRARRTPVVSGVDLTDLEAVYDMRCLIELPLVARARRSATPQDHRRVQAAFEAYRAVADEPSSSAYWLKHAKFHWSLIEGAATPWTRRVLDPLWTSSERYVRLFVYTYAAPGQTLDLHRELLDAFEDSAEAVELELERHFALTVAGVKAGFARAGQTSTTSPSGSS